MSSNTYQIYCSSYNKYKILLSFCEKKGYYRYQRDTVEDYAKWPWVIIYPSNKRIGGNSTDSPEFITVEFADAFDIPEFNYVSVRLNDSHTALVCPDGTIEVGCQTFHIRAVENILKAFNEIKTI